MDSVILFEIIIGIAGIILALLFTSIKIVQQYEKTVVFRLGKYNRTLSAGLNFVIPVIETSRTVDMRVVALEIPSQKVITKDNVPLGLTGVLYYNVENIEDATIKIVDFEKSIFYYCQTIIKDIVGSFSLDEVLSEREQLAKKMEAMLKAETQKFGVFVDSIKIQDILLPVELEKMISRQASAEREKRANVIKSQGDLEASQNLAKASEIMMKSNGAMQLRTLQTIDALAPSPSNTVVLFPVDILNIFKDIKGLEVIKK